VGTERTDIISTSDVREIQKKLVILVCRRTNYVLSLHTLRKRKNGKKIEALNNDKTVIVIEQ